MEGHIFKPITLGDFLEPTLTKICNICYGVATKLDVPEDNNLSNENKDEGHVKSATSNTFGDNE